MSSSSATEHLNQTHKAQVLAYLRYFQSKREEEAKEIDAVFEEQRDMRSLHSRAHGHGYGGAQRRQEICEVQITDICLDSPMDLLLLCVFVCVSLLEEMYPVDEVGSILDGVKQLIKGQVTEEMEKLAQQSVLYLRQVFLQAEGNGVAINVDLSQLDDASDTHTHTHTNHARTSRTHISTRTQATS